MQGINIFNFKKYFKRKGDNQNARIGHVNSLMPLVIEDSPNTLGLVPAFIGQIAVQPNNNRVWIAYNDANWTYIILD
jgi:hypothetical protein